ncbi:MAG: PKD domain-containing protein [Ignavibacteria bacterium]|nr:PKD domain-containing protein [Ignavibacteria bacterium]
MKFKILLFVFMFFCTLNVQAQVPTSISGVINKYVNVFEIDTCTKTLTVPIAKDFFPGDRALLIQMQGAVTDISNTANFGVITNIHQAGNYEIVTVSSIPSPNQIKLKSNPLHKYIITDKIQLVRIPQYASARVQGAPLTALPWNGTIGGILIFEVSGQLEILGTIDVTGKGFRGGRTNSPSNNESHILDYYGNYNQGRLAEKGESIGNHFLDRNAGRGANANGGGGGNPHNGGGGGGGNGGAGGMGGAHYADDALLIGGGGGYALDYATIGNRMFLGGGGGGGHQNEQIGSNGTAGGGIIIIKAGSLAGNNKSIISNGLDQTIQGHNDGQGGGGAGGSILLDLGQITSPITISAKGGFGGSIQRPWDIHAPGGGGGGGIISVNNPVHLNSITSNIVGGAPGILLQYNKTWKAEAGRPGLIKSGVTIPDGTKNNDIKLVSSDTVICPGGQVAFRGFTTDSANVLSWKWIFQDGQIVTNATNVTVLKSFPDTGSYRVNLVLEKNGRCSDTIVSMINVRSTIAITAPIPEGCPGSTLTLRSTLAGGNAPYTYTWTPVASSGIIGATTADSLVVKHDLTGTYSYKLAVQDASGCIASKVLTVNYFDPPLITPMQTVFGCSGEKATLTPTITKGKPPYNFQWVAQNLSSDFIISSGKLTNSLGVSSTIEGTYTYKLTVSDANGCQDSAIISYTVVPKPSFKNDAENPIVSCFEPNRPPTTIGDKITIAGGVPPYTFDWKEAGGGTSTIIGSQTTLETQVKPDITTTYILTVTDNNPNKKCPFTYTLIVEVRPVPDAPPSSDQIICACDATSIAQLGGEAKCGVQPYNYEWSPTTGLSNPTSTTTARTTAKPTQTTTYILQVTDGQARIAFDTVVVTVVPCPTVADTAIIICDVSVPKSIGVKVSGVPLEGMNYDWSPSIGLSAKNIENPTLTLPDSNATYNYTVNVRDKFGCPATATVTVKTSQTRRSGAKCLPG